VTPRDNRAHGWAPHRPLGAALLGLAVALPLLLGCRRGVHQLEPVSEPSLGRLGPLFRSDEWGLIVHAPRGWRVETGTDFGGAALFLGPIEGGFATNITVVSVPAVGQSLDDFCLSQERDLKAASEDIKIVKRSAGRLGDVPARLVRLKHRQDHTAIEALQCSALRAGRGYVLTLSAAAGHLDRHIPDFERCLADALLSAPEDPPQ